MPENKLNSIPLYLPFCSKSTTPGTDPSTIIQKVSLLIFSDKIVEFSKLKSSPPIIADLKNFALTITITDEILEKPDYFLHDEIIVSKNEKKATMQVKVSKPELLRTQEEPGEDDDIIIIIEGDN